MNRNFFFMRMLTLLIVCALIACGCESRGVGERGIPEIPSKLSENADGVPEIKVYNTASDSIDEMDIESYIMGVVAGEMKNTWPQEALKAQAILARTFTMKFISEKDSAYEGAHISTDVHEAQAYSADNINSAVREAVNATRGLVMAAGGDFPYAWFHAHSGGHTELPVQALEYKHNPSYLSAVKSEEADDAPEDVKHWRAEFTLEEVQKACKETGVDVAEIQSIEIGEKGESGRAIHLIVNGQRVSAPSFRIHIGAQKLKSTLLDSVEIIGDRVIFSGRGFGHGVGMSQWGAYKMAQDGMNAEQIIHHYFTGVNLVELW